MVWFIWLKTPCLACVSKTSQLTFHCLLHMIKDEYQVLGICLPGFNLFFKKIFVKQRLYCDELSSVVTPRIYSSIRF